jgi:WD40 repeat protein
VDSAPLQIKANVRLDSVLPAQDVNSPPLAAISTQDASVRVVDSRGEETMCGSVDQIHPASRSSPVTSLAWHPYRLLLAVAWKDGSFMIVALKENGLLHYTKSCPQQHHSAVVLLRWTVDGSAVIVGHEDGTLNMWVVRQNSELAVDWELDKV